MGLVDRNWGVVDKEISASPLESISGQVDRICPLGPHFRLGGQARSGAVAPRAAICLQTANCALPTFLVIKEPRIPAATLFGGTAAYSLSRRYRLSVLVV